MDRRRRDQPAINGGLRVVLIEIKRVIFANGCAIQLDGVPRQRVGNGLARLAGDDVVPDFPQIGVFPEVGLKGVRLSHFILPKPSLLSCRLAEFVIWYNQSAAL